MKVQTDSVKDTVYLGDFGLTIKVGDPVKEKWHRPVEYCAPEQFHNEYPSYASDMWSYMCLFAKLSLGVTPFYGNSSNIISSDMTNVLGPMPPEWKGCYEGDGQSDASWYDKSRKPADGRTLRELIGRARKEINDAEADEIESIMKKGFCYSVNDRITAAELLQDDSFKALMRRYQVA
jgi:serine/threonine protein kinase